MNNLCVIDYMDLEPNKTYESIIIKVIKKCFEVECFQDSNLYINVILTTPENIRKVNNQYRNIDKETDVLSFPMFEKKELEELIKNTNINMDILGDMIISIQRVQEQAIEYEHSFERELAYMVVHSFYHLIGYDHIEEADKLVMRKKEENVLELLDIKR